MRGWTIALAFLLTLSSTPAAQPRPVPSIDLFFAATAADDRVAREALDQIASQWNDSYAPLIIDLARQLRPAARRQESALPSGSLGDDDPTGAAEARGGPDVGGAPISRESIIRSRLLRFLERHTGKRFDDSLNGWREWMWTLPYDPHPDYGEFKGRAYARIDPRMQAFFPRGVQSIIRLDEIDWGGVAVNGIPPLVYPRVVSAADARYLRDGNLVFGVVVNGEARAYPKRILAWHELATDRVGNVELTVVYCTLCGTVIPYESTVAGKVLRFGTSGLLYRSNKLMFDETTASLWSALEGKPVVGPLVAMDVALTPREVVTTTWGEWRTLHPDTTVLSDDTGHTRDYREGAAYRDYFRTDDLYFRVSQVDKRLKNKEEVLTVRVKPRGFGDPQAVAITASFLRKNRVFHFDAGGRRLLVVTSAQGANRVYDVGDHAVVFQGGDSDLRLTDARGNSWRVTEEAVIDEREASRRLPRLAAARAFWFGWYAQFPDTMLIR